MTIDAASALYDFQPVRRDIYFAPDERAGSSPQTQQPERVLIVEDDLLNALHMESALAEAGFDVIGVAASGEDAIALVQEQLPSLAVVDVRLAGDMDGVDTAIALLRSHGVRCVFATAHSDEETRRRAGVAAPLGWLQKPYTMHSLVAAVRAALEQLREQKS